MTDDEAERDLMDDGGAEAPPAGDVSSEHRTWAMIAHLATLSGYVGLPFGWILGPLIVYLVKKDESPFVATHAKEALNMGISATIYLLVSIPLMFILIGILTAAVVSIAAIVLAIIAGIKANEGRNYRYPYIIRFVK